MTPPDLIDWFFLLPEWLKGVLGFAGLQYLLRRRGWDLQIILEKIKKQKRLKNNMAAIVITAATDATQTSLVIEDRTDWTSIGDTISSLTSIDVEIYTTSLVTPAYTYSLSSPEVDYYVLNGTITLTFLTIAGQLYLDDGFYNVKLSANTGDYISNNYGFGVYADITYAVFSEINSLDTPESIKFNAEKFCTYAMFLEGLKYLDTTSVNNRDIKFNKRLTALNKMLLNI